MHVSRHTNRNDSLIKALKIEIIWLRSLVYGTPEGHFFLSNTFHLYTTDSLDVKGFFYLFIYFSRGDYIPHTHMLAQSYCRAIRRRAYFILGRAGVNVKIWVWRLKRTDAQARYIAVALVVAAAAVKIVVNNIAGGVNQPHRVVRSLFFLTRLLNYRHVQTWKHLGGLP